jgi:hypothetical protein
MRGLLKRRVAYAAEFSDKCVAVQLTYLKCGCCRGLKPDADAVRMLDGKVRQQWVPKRIDYFDPTWLKNELDFTQARSATFKVDPRNPVETLHTAISNLDFNKPDPHSTWESLDEKKSYTAIVIVNNKETKESHAIGLRKSNHAYFFHDILTEATTPTAVEQLDCHEFHVRTIRNFEKNFNSHIKIHLDQGYSELLVIELIPTTPRKIQWLGFPGIPSLGPADAGLFSIKKLRNRV